MLFDDIIKQSAPIRQGKPKAIHRGNKYNAFFRSKNGQPFDELNNKKIPSKLEIQRYQRTKIINSYNAITSNIPGAIEFEKFLSTHVPDSFETKLDEALKLIPNAIQQYFSGKINLDTKGYTDPSYQNNLNMIINNLTNAVTQLGQAQSVNGSFPLSYLKDVIRKFNELKTATNNKSAQSIMGDLWSLQGKNAEAMAVEHFKYLVPQIKNISFSSNNRVIQMGDVFEKGTQGLVDVGLYNLLDELKIEYSKNGGKPLKKSIEEFFNDIENDKKASFNITNPDELKKAQVIGLQVKSGYNTALYRKTSKNTQVSLADLKPREHPVFNLLYQMYKSWLGAYKHAGLKSTPKEQMYTSTATSSLQAIMDYQLATQLYKVLHMTENQFIYGPHGFESIPKAVDRLYFNNNKYFHVSTINDIWNDIYDTVPYKVSIRKV